VGRSGPFNVGWDVAGLCWLRCAVLCCAVLCCAVPCCAVLCCAVLCHSVLGWAVLGWAGLGWAVLCCALQHGSVSCRIAIRTCDKFMSYSSSRRGQALQSEGPSYLSDSTEMCVEQMWLQLVSQSWPSLCTSITSEQLLTRCVCCSAYKNKGVQMLLDGVTAYLPSPLDVTNRALDVNKNQAPLELPSSQQVRLCLIFSQKLDKKHISVLVVFS